MGEENIFIGRQPIMKDASKKYAYELLFRSSSTGKMDFKNNLHATSRVVSSVINHFTLKELTGNLPAFINIDHTILGRNFISLLPKEKYVLELLESTQVNQKTLNKIEELHKLGYRFAIDDFDFSQPMIEKFRPLLKFVEIIKIDIPTVDQDKLYRYMDEDNRKHTLLAEKIENVEEYEICRDLGFDLYQGYFFHKPELLRKRVIEPSQVVLMKIAMMLQRDEDPILIERYIKKIPDLIYGLIRFLNTPAVGAKERITSILQCITLLGNSGLMKWVLVYLYAQTKENQFSQALLDSALFRAHFMQEVCRKYTFTSIKGEGFITGMFSLFSALFEVEEEGLVQSVPNLSTNIREALLDRRGLLGNLLLLCEAIEDQKINTIYTYASRLTIDTKDVLNLSKSVLIELEKSRT
jgi:c-di-GMP phosphodiesterase